MPSLRERKEDIPLLAEHFALRAAGEMGKVPVTFTEAALEILKNHTWPGNIRELENCIERLTIIASGTAITPERLASCAVPGGGDASRPSAPAVKKEQLSAAGFHWNPQRKIWWKYAA